MYASNHRSKTKEVEMPSLQCATAVGLLVCGGLYLSVGNVTDETDLRAKVSHSV